MTRSDLRNSGIPDEIIRALSEKAESPRLNLGVTPEKIPDGYTEVYFWGVSGSGKTTAIAGILNQIESVGFFDPQLGAGYEYMIQLRSLFNRKQVSILPSSSVVDITQCMNFYIGNDIRTNRVHPVAIVEISGEIFDCFLHFKEGKKINPHKQETFDNLMKLLSGKNRKIHFFVIDSIDLISEPKGNNNGLCLNTFLTAAADFFEKKRPEIFIKSTEAICVLVTKSDLLPADTNEGKMELIKKRLEVDYLRFVMFLQNICKRNRINRGALMIVPFSIGTVYFGNFCIFDGDSSRNLVQVLKDRTELRTSSASFWERIKNVIK